MRAKRSFVLVPRTIAFVVALAGLVTCGGDDAETTPTLTTTHATVSPDTAPPDTTASAATIPPSTSSAPTTTDSVVPAPADVCDDELDSMLAVVDESIGGARLASGEPWMLDAAGAEFDERTQPAEEFAYRLGLDCTVRAAQTTADGGERLVLGAWTGDRRAWVAQATDGPPTPYSPAIRFQLFIDQPYGEWIDEQATWVGTLDTGETVIVGTVDTYPALAAKSWWNEIPRFDDLEVTIDAERYAIDALEAAGARNVSVAESADYVTELAAIQHITPEGLVLIATIGPPDWFDVAAVLFEGEQTVEQIGGVDVYVTTGAPTAYATASVGWMCGEYVWYIDSVYGTVEELTDWAATIIESTGC